MARRLIKSLEHPQIIEYENLGESNMGDIKGVQTNVVSIVKDSWSPDVVESYFPLSIEIIPGTTVTWTNDDSMIHTVTDAKKTFDSEFIPSGGTWQYTFEKPGQYDYLCTLHPWMKGIVNVVEESSHSMT